MLVSKRLILPEKVTREMRICGETLYGDSLFLQTCWGQTKGKTLYHFNIKTGELLWQVKDTFFFFWWYV